MSTDRRPPATDDEMLRRRWRLRGTVGKDVVHDEVVTGDRALDVAMKDLECVGGVRIRVDPA